MKGGEWGSIYLCEVNNKRRRRFVVEVLSCDEEERVWTRKGGARSI